MRRFLYRWIGGVGVVCGCSILMALTVGRVLSTEEEVIYASANEHDEFDIFRMALFRHLAVGLTHNSGDNIGPIWSPDGQQIAFISNRDGVYRLYLMDDEGHHVQRLTTEPLSKRHLNWSPDGQFILYASEQSDHQELRLIEPQSRVERALDTDRHPYITPDWSPDSKDVTFISDRSSSGEMNIFNLDVQTGRVTPFLTTPGHDLSLSWSQDGHYLLFTVDRLPPSIYLWDTHTAQFILLDAAISPNSVPNWSPDSRKLIYTAFTHHGDLAIYILNIPNCLQSTMMCAPELTTVIPNVYASPQWRPMPK